jgi:hypothetical protein
VDELETRLREAVQPLLDAGEELRGVCVGTRVGLFRGRMVALAATDRRLLIQGLTRRFARHGEAISIPPERLADASAEGAGGGWPELGAAVMDRAAVTLKLRTTDGERIKLTLMRGSGPLGELGGGQAQRQGIEAVAGFFAEAARSAG